MGIRSYRRHSSSRSNIDIILVQGRSPLSDHILTDIWSHVSSVVCTGQMSVMQAIYLRQLGLIWLIIWQKWHFKCPLLLSLVEVWKGVIPGVLVPWYAGLPLLLPFGLPLPFPGCGEDGVLPLPIFRFSLWTFTLWVGWVCRLIWPGQYQASSWFLYIRPRSFSGLWGFLPFGFSFSPFYRRTGKLGHYHLTKRSCF